MSKKYALTREEIINIFIKFISDDISHVTEFNKHLNLIDLLNLFLNDVLPGYKAIITPKKASKKIIRTLKKDFQKDID